MHVEPNPAISERVRIIEITEYWRGPFVTYRRIAPTSRRTSRWANVQHNSRSHVWAPGCWRNASIKQTRRITDHACFSAAEMTNSEYAHANAVRIRGAVLRVVSRMMLCVCLMIGVCKCTLRHVDACVFAGFNCSLRRKQFVHVTQVHVYSITCAHTPND